MPRPRRTPRRAVLAAVGAVLGSAVSFGFLKAARGGKGGSCAGVRCEYVALGGGVGAIAGYFIGREYDLNFAARFRNGVPLRPPNRALEIAGEPFTLAARDSLVAVATSIGVEMFSAVEPFTGLTLRARGIRGIVAVDIAPRSGWLSLGSHVGIYAFPPRGGPGALLREGDVGAITSSPARIFFGVNDRIESAPVGVDSTGPWPGLALGTAARALQLETSRPLLWAATDKELMSFRIGGDTLAPLGRTALDAAARRLAVRGTRAAVAAGEAGVRLFDIADPAAPRLLASWTRARFAYDVSLDSTRMFVAAGPEGVYVVDVGGATPRTIGLARTLGFATAITSLDGYTFILDRRANALRRIVSNF